MTLKAIIAAAMLALMAAPASAQVPEPYARELAQRLSEMDQVVADQNYRRAAGPFADGLSQGQRQSFSVTLHAGQDYRVAGVCDGHCGDLNLRIRDPNGAMLDEDVVRGAAPALVVRPMLTGQHVIEVDMAQCRTPRCWFAFNVYAR